MRRERRGKREAGRGNLGRWPTTARAALLVLAATMPLAAQLAAQQPAHESAARVFAIRPREGMERQFEDGYRRHLGWHQSSRDPWAWYMWQVTNGEREGLYVDGTFEHRWADFDAAVDPRGDGADNAVNVDAFATRPWNAAWRRLGATGADFATVAERSSFLLVVEYRLRPVDAARVFDSLDRARAVRPIALSSGTDGAPAPPAWFALVSGGEGPALVLVVPLARWGAVSSVAADPLRAALGALELPRGDAGTERLYREITAAATSTRSEIWRFRPDLSVCRATESRCQGTLGARGE